MVPNSEGNDEVSLFEEIQRHLALGQYFFVEQHSTEGYALYSHTMLYHQNGDFKCVANYDVEKELSQRYSQS